MVEGIGTTLGDEIVHGNALLLGDGAQSAYKFFGQPEGFVYHLRLLHIKHWNPPFDSILRMIFNKIHTLKILHKCYCQYLCVIYTCKTYYVMIEYFMYRLGRVALKDLHDGCKKWEREGVWA